ncbi:hypothetical protein N9L68_01345 [bacterium]|nr:hypothetical protein [bacterium]
MYHCYGLGPCRNHALQACLSSNSGVAGVGPTCHGRGPSSTSEESADIAAGEEGGPREAARGKKTAGSGPQ